MAAGDWGDAHNVLLSRGIVRRCTHTLPGELERARDLLDRFLAERATKKASGA